jgi:hypothetical protein
MGFDDKCNPATKEFSDNRRKNNYWGLPTFYVASSKVFCQGGLDNPIGICPGEKRNPYQLKGGKVLVGVSSGLSVGN